MNYRNFNKCLLTGLMFCSFLFACNKEALREVIQPTIQGRWFISAYPIQFLEYVKNADHLDGALILIEEINDLDVEIIDDENAIVNAVGQKGAGVFKIKDDLLEVGLELGHSRLPSPQNPYAFWVKVSHPKFWTSYQKVVMIDTLYPRRNEVIRMYRIDEKEDLSEDFCRFDTSFNIGLTTQIISPPCDPGLKIILDGRMELEDVDGRRMNASTQEITVKLLYTPGGYSPENFDFFPPDFLSPNLFLESEGFLKMKLFVNKKPIARINSYPIKITKADWQPSLSVSGYNEIAGTWENLKSIELQDSLTIEEIYGGWFLGNSIPIDNDGFNIKVEIEDTNFDAAALMDHIEYRVCYNNEPAKWVSTSTNINSLYLQNIPDEFKDSIEIKTYIQESTCASQFLKSYRLDETIQFSNLQENPLLAIDVRDLANYCKKTIPVGLELNGLLWHRSANCVDDSAWHFLGEIKDGRFSTRALVKGEAYQFKLTSPLLDQAYLSENITIPDGSSLEDLLKVDENICSKIAF